MLLVSRTLENVLRHCKTLVCGMYRTLALVEGSMKSYQTVLLFIVGRWLVFD